ncbi:hypothetical protein ACFX11_046763 [Malus domestica]|uniref:Uncharacterized protein n=1 Tax=Malus domestica TaxID=3750 RepID=A0A498J1J3_MALDO|nr:hypothetical protein DVH24_000124 [Malus domestica]
MVSSSKKPKLVKWFEVEMDILEFRMLYIIRLNLDDHDYFAGRASLVWETYIQDVPCHDKDWFEDILIVDRVRFIASTSFFAFPPLLQVSINEPSCRDGLSSTDLLRSEGTIYPPLVTRASIDRVAISSDASGLQNTYYAQKLLKAVIALANFK